MNSDTFDDVFLPATRGGGVACFPGASIKLVSPNHVGNSDKLRGKWISFRFGPEIVKKMKWQPRDRVSIRANQDRTGILFKRTTEARAFAIKGPKSPKEASVEIGPSVASLRDVGELLAGMFPERRAVRWQEYDGGLLLWIKQDAA